MEYHKYHIPLLQAMDGFPKCPVMHSQTPLCDFGRHMAFSPQVTREHAGTQLPCEHFWSKLQS